MTPERTKGKQGFASMDRRKQREIARMGGLVAQSRGVAHRWTSKDAAEAGRKGGSVSRGGRGRLAE